MKNESGRYGQEETGKGEYRHEEAGLTRGLMECLHEKGHDRRNLELVQSGCNAAEENDDQDEPG